MHDLSGPQELNRLCHIRVIGKAQDVVIAQAGLLLCGQILVQVRDGVPSDRKGGCGGVPEAAWG